MGHLVFAKGEVARDTGAPIADLMNQGGPDSCLTWKAISGVALLALLFWVIHRMMQLNDFPHWGDRDLIRAA